MNHYTTEAVVLKMGNGLPTATENNKCLVRARIKDGTFIDKVIDLTYMPIFKNEERPSLKPGSKIQIEFDVRARRFFNQSVIRQFRNEP